MTKTKMVRIVLDNGNSYTFKMSVEEDKKMDVREFKIRLIDNNEKAGWVCFEPIEYESVCVRVDSIKEIAILLPDK